jgi:hypothetical protein
MEARLEADPAIHRMGRLRGFCLGLLAHHHAASADDDAVSRQQFDGDWNVTRRHEVIGTARIGVPPPSGPEPAFRGTNPDRLLDRGSIEHGR